MAFLCHHATLRGRSVADVAGALQGGIFFYRQVNLERFSFGLDLRMPASEFIHGLINSNVLKHVRCSLNAF